MDWACRFGGRIGLPALEKLAQDPSLTPEGRDRAKCIHDLIIRGEHVKFLEWALTSKGLPPWPIPTLWKYIYERDRASLLESSPSPPE